MEFPLESESSIDSTESTGETDPTLEIEATHHANAKGQQPVEQVQYRRAP
jgi:hypothetical protein